MRLRLVISHRTTGRQTIISKPDFIMLQKFLLLSPSVCFLLSADSASIAQSNPTFTQLGRAKGALYKPDSGSEPRIGIVVMHRESNYMNNVACGEFARRGFMVLVMHSPLENSEVSG